MSTPVSQNQQAKCLSLKEKAHKAVDDAKLAAKERFTQIGKGLVQIVLAPVNTILSEIRNKAKTISDEFNNALELPQKYDKIRAEKWAEIQRKFRELTTDSSCTTETPTINTNPINGVISAPTTIKTNVVAQTMASPSSNDNILNTSTLEYRHKKLIEDSVSKSVDDQIAAVQNISNKFDTMSIPAVRENVRQMIGKRVEIDEALSTSPYGKLQSEYVGSHTIAYTVDKPSLQLKDWGVGKPVIIRKNITEKLSKENRTEIQKAYDITNQGLYNNLPKEFKDEQTTFGFGATHSYHIAGDCFYYEYHLNNDTVVGTTINAATLTNIGKTNKMINYINPVVEDITIENTPLLVIEENYEVPIDNRKNIIRTPLTKNQSLLPITVNTL